jgi:hypothetical protein
MIAGWQSRTNEDAQPGTTRRSLRPSPRSVVLARLSTR